MNEKLTNKKLKNFYDKTFLKGEKKHFTPFVIRGVRTEFIEVLKEADWEGKKIIDIGCGTGQFDFLVAKKGGHVLGVDYSSEAIKIAKKKYSHPNLSFQQYDASKKLPGKYDIIVSLGTLEHQDNPLKTLKSFKKYLNPKGIIIITSPNWTNPRGYFLLTLYYLFNAPITLADLHYFSPIDFMKFAEKLDMKLSWRTIDFSWANGDELIKDLKRRLPKIFADMNQNKKNSEIKNFLKWVKQNVLLLDNSLKHGGATGLYIFQKK